MKEVAKKIVDQALSSGADEAEVFMIESEGKGFSIEKNSVSSLSGGLERGLGIRVIKDRKSGFAYSAPRSPRPKNPLRMHSHFQNLARSLTSHSRSLKATVRLKISMMKRY